MPFSWTPPTGLNDTSAFPRFDTGFRARVQALLQQLATYTDGLANKVVTTATRAVNTAGTQSINLGFQPRLVRIRAFLSVSSGGNYDSDGSFDGTNQACLLKYGNGTLAPGSTSSAIIFMHDGVANQNYATVTFTATGINLVWTIAGALPAGNIIMKIEAV